MVNLRDRYLMNITQHFHKYLDLNFVFRIAECYPAVEIEGNKNNWIRVPKFYEGKSHTISSGFSNRFPLAYTQKYRLILGNILIT